MKSTTTTAAPASPATILTNMAYWQSPAWRARADSLYDLDGITDDPAFQPWWKDVIQLYRRAPAYDVVMTMGIRESFAYAALSALLGHRADQIMTEVFIDQPRPSSLAWRVKTALYRRLARHITGGLTYSTVEIETNARRFAMPRERFRYIPLASTIDEPVYDPRPGGYLFCAGRTLRDYATLTSIMLATDLPWHVVVGHGDLAGEALPPRITVHREINRTAYLDLLRGARIVVLPLLDTERSTGQVVLLEAMSYGKPVITTRTPGTIDIVRHDENGWLVEPNDADGTLRLLTGLLNAPARCERAGRAAFADITTKYTHTAHTRQRLSAIEELRGQSSA